MNSLLTAHLRGTRSWPRHLAQSHMVWTWLLLATVPLGCRTESDAEGDIFVLNPRSAVAVTHRGKLCLSRRELRKIVVEGLDGECRTDVTHITVARNHLANLPGELALVFPAVSRIDLSANMFRELPGCVYQFDELAVLWAHACRIESLEDAIANLSHLQSLDLSANCLCNLSTIIRSSTCFLRINAGGTITLFACNF